MIIGYAVIAAETKQEEKKKQKAKGKKEAKQSLRFGLAAALPVVGQGKFRVGI